MSHPLNAQDASRKVWSKKENRALVLETFFAGFAYFDALAPLRIEDLVRADAAAGMGIEDAVDDVAAAGLECWCQ